MRQILVSLGFFLFSIKLTAMDYLVHMQEVKILFKNDYKFINKFNDDSGSTPVIGLNMKKGDDLIHVFVKKKYVMDPPPPIGYKASEITTKEEIIVNKISYEMVHNKAHGAIKPSTVFWTDLGDYMFYGYYRSENNDNTRSEVITILENTERK